MTGRNQSLPCSLFVACVCVSAEARPAFPTRYYSLAQISALFYLLTTKKVNKLNTEIKNKHTLPLNSLFDRVWLLELNPPRTSH